MGVFEASHFSTEGVNAVKPDTLIPRPHLSTKPGQVQSFSETPSRWGDANARRRFRQFAASRTTLATCRAVLSRAAKRRLG